MRTSAPFLLVLTRETRVACRAGAFVALSTDAGRRAYGFPPRSAAYFPYREWPWPSGIAATPSAIAGCRKTNAWSDPKGEETVTPSPSESPRAAAVFGPTSTQFRQTAVAMGSGSSCSHGRFAPRPSNRAMEG